MGRPSGYGVELADIICTRIGEGESVNRICQDEDMPHAASVYRWLQKHEGFRRQYMLAKDWQAEGFADELIEIADGDSQDCVEATRDGKTVKVWREGAVKRDALRVDTRKWIAARLLPKKYGKSQPAFVLTRLESKAA